MNQGLFLPVPEKGKNVEVRALINSVGNFNRWIERQGDILKGCPELLVYPIPFSLHPSSRMRAFQRILEQAGWHVVKKETQRNGQLVWILKLPESYLKQQKQKQKKWIFGICIVSAVIILLLFLLLRSFSS
ncbi:TPA: hypothetical protein DEP34_00005 [Candidatus Uhrbacteria bacterium]|uniref:Uncharacterized protein n=2 Tax=Candidatus Uhriibacteriota TaxID=1752732 RepID=A0A0G1QAF5_9BACT|nr:MAG: hypothetical protein UX45_C0002G0001 [Candidatus Uhrbacteria bacterium GW2011_GWF2_46_218]KKU41777.1 MAG: hypothetical protein UX57_C0001G0001 [Candidatus Uhrbacteria bacterium GW2011_GWE2_46_68]HCB18755.1 hypothetical protein [Candidatus Uhrbacteria bacterium]